MSLMITPTNPAAITLAAGQSIVVKDMSGASSLLPASLVREDASARIGAGFFVYGPATADGSFTLSTTGQSFYNIVNGDPTPADQPVLLDPGNPPTSGPTLSGASAGAVIGAAGASPANPTAALGDSISHQNNYKTTPSAISVSGSVVTLTVNAHGQATGNGIRITGYTQTEFNGDFTLTRIDANNFSYTLSQAPTTTTPSGTGYVAFATLAANNGYLNHANAILGGRLNVVAIEGVPGERADQIALRVGKVIAAKAKHVLVLAGTNDFRGSNNTPAQVFATCRDLIWKPLIASGAYVYAMGVIPLGATDTPTNGLTVNQANSNITAFNQLVRDYCAATAGMTYVPTHGAIVDTTALTGVALSAKLEDQIHPSPRGAYAMGKAIAAAMLPNLKQFNNLANSPADSVAVFAGSSNVISNPFFLAGTGGTLSGGVTGAAAQDWNVTLFAGATVAASLVARTDAADGDTLGNNQRLTATFAANNDSFQVTSTFAAASYISAGDVLFGEAAVKMTNTPSNLKRLLLVLDITVGGVTYNGAAQWGYGTASNNLQLEDGTWVLRTPKFVVPAGTVTSAALRVFCQGAGAASSFTLDIGRAVLRKAS